MSHNNMGSASNPQHNLSSASAPQLDNNIMVLTSHSWWQRRGSLPVFDLHSATIQRQYCALLLWS